MPDWSLVALTGAVLIVIVVIVVARFVGARSRGNRGMKAANQVLGGASSAAGVQSSMYGFPVPRLGPVDPPMVDERDADGFGRER